MDEAHLAEGCTRSAAALDVTHTGSGATKTARLIQDDLAHVWHPTSQMKDYETFLPLCIERAVGSYLYLADGSRVLDGIASWWCKSLGHAHPTIQAAVQAQMARFEHVILANTTHAGVVSLCQSLAQMTPSLDKVFFASDGACAIEIAVKMSLHSRRLQGQMARTRFMALANDYHGETSLALALTDMPAFKQAYAPLLPAVEFVQNVPYVTGMADPLWSDCSAVWPAVEAQLAPLAEQLSGIVVEPIVQGAAGFKIYSADFLRRLRAWCTAHDVHLLADEIMTGFYRTGRQLACEHAGIEPDFLCLSKGLTAGWLPMSVVLTSSDIYALFYDDYATGKAFLHSHTHSGNALAVAAAQAMFVVMQAEHIPQRVQALAPKLQACFAEVAEATGCLQQVRGLGAFVAAELICPANQGDARRWGYEVCRAAVARGVLLRPAGNTLYWVPPLNIADEDLLVLRDATIGALRAVIPPVS